MQAESTLILNIEGGGEINFKNTNARISIFGAFTPRNIFADALNKRSRVVYTRRLRDD